LNDLSLLLWADAIIASLASSLVDQRFNAHPDSPTYAHRNWPTPVFAIALLIVSDPPFSTPSHLLM